MSAARAEPRRSVTQLNPTQPTVSKHPEMLRGAGLVEVRQDAQRRWYRLRPQPLAEIDAWPTPYRRMWQAAQAASAAPRLDVA